VIARLVAALIRFCTQEDSFGYRRIGVQPTAVFCNTDLPAS